MPFRINLPFLHVATQNRREAFGFLSLELSKNGELFSASITGDMAEIELSISIRAIFAAAHSAVVMCQLSQGEEEFPDSAAWIAKFVGELVSENRRVAEIVKQRLENEVPRDLTDEPTEAQ